MVSGKIIPRLYPMLVYLGIDLIDSSYLLFLSSENFYDAVEQLLPIYKIKSLPCSCVACRGKLKGLLNDKYSSEKLILLCLHNLILANIYTNKIKQYLSYEDYRAFVEKSSLNIWLRNYWNRPRIIPKVIFGRGGKWITLFPRINIDILPRLLPYKI